MSLDLSINLGKSSSYSRLVPPETRRSLHFPSEGPFLLHPTLRVTSCSQDILKMSLISNWWETKPPAKKQQFTAARFYFQDSSTRPSKTSRLPSNRTRSSPTKSSAQLQQVLFSLVLPGHPFPAAENSLGQSLCTRSPPQELWQTLQAETEAKPPQLQSLQDRYP